MNCSLKWGNERNPRRVLYVSHETAPLLIFDWRLWRQRRVPYRILIKFDVYAVYGDELLVEN